MSRRIPAVGRVTVWMVVLSVVLSSGPARGQDTTYEEAPTFKASEILAPEQLRGPHHRVAEEIANDGYMNTYRIDSDFGRFEAYGDGILAIRIREVGALAELDEVSKSEVFKDAVARGTVAGVKSVAAIATKPVATVKGLPGGAKRMFKSYKRDVDEGVEVVKEATADDEAEGDQAESTKKESKSTSDYANKFLGVNKAERRWAEKLVVDPYSSNHVLREAIRKVAKIDAATSLGMRFASPIPSIPGIRYVSEVNKYVWSTDPRELREQNIKRLAEGGADEAVMDLFFENPWYSPTTETFMIALLAGLEGVEGRDVALELAAAVESKEEAFFFLQTVSMLSGFHSSVTPIGRLIGGARLPAAVTGTGRLIFVAPVEYISWTEGIAGAADGPFGEVGRGLDLETKEFWFRGKASARCRNELTQRGWMVRDGVEFATE